MVELQHRHICPVCDLGESADYGCFQVMKFTPGVSLHAEARTQFVWSRHASRCPAVESRTQAVQLGHDWVVVCVVVSGLPWAPPTAFALPVGFRLHVNKQGLTKGKKKRRSKKGSGKRHTTPAPAGHRTRPGLAVELLTLVSEWFPERMFVVTGDSLYGGKSVLQHLPDGRLWNIRAWSQPTTRRSVPCVRR